MFIKNLPVFTTLIIGMSVDFKEDVFRKIFIIVLSNFVIFLALPKIFKDFDLINEKTLKKNPIIHLNLLFMVVH